MNRLETEKSPYLQMHRENPVDWFPWDAPAFDEARRQNKPVFLSIGYSSCHWCHVIAHESFEDAQIAEVLNQSFISVKVDKEERPDVDAVYMDAVQLATGAGGWPMTLLVTPEGKPFFAATYLSKDALLRLLRKAASLWETDRDAVVESAEAFTQRMVEAAGRPIKPKTPSAKLTDDALREFEKRYDEKWGGFGSAPKFPAAHNLIFLLAYHARAGEASGGAEPRPYEETRAHNQHTSEASALAMVEGTLAAMARGGIFDHIGGGFCRYSVDRRWLVPHFEKMLYDNALLLWAYARAWQATQKPLYREIARRTAAYVLAEMTGEGGAFFCAQDADSEGREGAYYLFSRDEIVALLGDEDGARFCDFYDITESGNFEGLSIPNRIGKPFDPDAEAKIAPLRARVYAYRRNRLPLRRDDKILTSWNALMITALCEAARALDAPEYLDAARSAEAFLQKHLMRDDGALMLRWRDGEAKGEGVLADYAGLLLAEVTLLEFTGDRAYLARAERLAGDLLERFGDDMHGGLFLYAHTGEALIIRPKEIWDAAMPSGNSLAALALGKLARHTGDPKWRDAADRQLRFVAGAAEEAPTAFGFGLLAIEDSFI